MVTSTLAKGWNRARVFEFAEAKAVEHGYEPGMDLRHIVERLGGEIVYLETSEITSSTGSMLVREDGTFVVYLSRYTSGTRDRFTTAHELGHYFLHLPELQAQGVSGPWAFNRHGSNTAEVEANWFAAAYLMPAAAFTASFEEHGGDALQVAWDFDVSYESARIRVGSLNLHPSA